MTKQRTYNRRRAHLLRKKDNWSKPKARLSINGIDLGWVDFSHELRMYKPRRWTDDQVDALKRPIEFFCEFRKV